MSRLFKMLQTAMATLVAAGQATASVRQHRMPSQAALVTLGIDPAVMRQVKL